jgi:hypothetical protein
MGCQLRHFDSKNRSQVVYFAGLSQEPGKNATLLCVF